MNIELNNAQVVVNCNFSALGDNICALPVIKLLIKHNALDQLACAEKFAWLFRQVVPESRLVVVPEEGTVQIRSDWTIRNAFRTDITTLGIHLIDYQFISIADYLPMDLAIKSLPLVIPTCDNPVTTTRPYVVVCAGHTSVLKRMRDDLLEDIVNYLESLGYDSVILGSKYKVHIRDGIFQEIEFAKVPDHAINLINKTTIEQAHAIISGAAAIIGIDSGLLHLAGLTQVPIIAGYTHKDPAFLLPIRDGVLGKAVYPVTPPATSCQGCMTSRVFPMQDFRFCARGDTQCVSSMRFEDFKQAINKGLANGYK